MRLLTALSLFLLPFVLAAQFELNGRTVRKLQQLLEFNETIASASFGFALYDLETENYLYGLRARGYFVPASNVKLLTFALAHRTLGNQGPAAFYREFPDRFEIWGSGYPLLLHPEFFGFDELYPWLLSRGKPLVFNLPEEGPPRYGAGWSWDDYPYGYVYERSALPVYGNRLFLDVYRGNVVVYPGAYAGAMLPAPGQKSLLTRKEATNNFTTGDRFPTHDNYPLQRALRMTDETTARLLAEALPERLAAIERKPLPPAATGTYFSASIPDTVYRKVLTNSDNYLAEQLLLQAAVRRYGTFDEGAIFTYGTDTLLAELGPFRWDDASGLSRYNLVQPDQFARLLIRLDREVGRERLKDLLATGGRTGTLKTRFVDESGPFLWAKTGSLSGVMAISGILETRRGRALAFSFLMNNYLGSPEDAYRELERLARFLRDNL